METNIQDPTQGQTPNLQDPQGQQTEQNETTRQEVQLPKILQDEMMSIVKKYKSSWQPKRRLIVRRVLRSYEFAKGNHSSAYDPDSQSYVDAFELLMGSDSDKFEDNSLYKFATNFYQMLWFAFVSALSIQVPETQALPDNAEREEDIATAKAYSNVIAKIDEQNNAKKLHKKALTLFWLAGSCFRHTRYVVDADFAGTHQEPIIENAPAQIPSRFICQSCGSVVPEGDDDNGTCPDCHQPLEESQYYPSEVVEIPQVVSYQDTPNGMVKQTWHSPLEVDADPNAKTLKESAIINVETEVDIAAAREAFPDNWDDLTPNSGSTSENGVQDRMARDAAKTEGNGRNYLTEERVTISRTWIQKWAFNKAKDKKTADMLKEQFPDGCLMVNSGEKFLAAYPCKPMDEWTWAGTVNEDFGLYPPGVGDASIPLQEMINDIGNLLHEHYDRVGLGISFVDESAVDTSALNNKPILPGVLNGVLRAKKGTVGTAGPLADLFHHFEVSADESIHEYLKSLIFNMQLLAGTPPQIFGGAGDPNIQTATGQGQQLNTAMGKLMLFWDNLRDEKAESSELAVRCAAKNMTDDWFTVVTDQSKTFRNQYVRMDEMKGNLKVKPATDQAFPMTHAEIKAWWDKFIEAAPQNPAIQALLSVPANIRSAITYSGVPGLKSPDESMENKILRIMEMLAQGQPQVIQGQTGPQMVPSVAPEPDVDDMQLAITMVKDYLREHFEMKWENPPAYANILAYLRACSALDEQQKIAQSMPAPGQNPNPNQNPAPPAQA